MNKLIPVITVIALLTMTLFVMNDSEALTSGYWEFTVDEHGNATITKYTKTSAIPNEIVVPSTVSSGGVTYPVKTVGEHFEPGSSFRVVFPKSGGYSLTFSEGIEKIENYACYGLGSYFRGTLTLPSTLTYIGDYAFNHCTFTGELIIPDSVTYIGSYAFGSCGGLLTKLKLPNGITSIAEYSFASMVNLHTTLVIPEGVTSVGEGAFSSTQLLNNISEETFIVLPSTLTTVGQYAFTFRYGGPTYNMPLYNLSSLPITLGDSTNYGGIGAKVSAIYTSLPTAPSITSSPSGTTVAVGGNWDYTVVYAGEDAVMTATYPNWITLSGDVMSGTNAPGGSYPIEITVTDKFYRTATQTFTITVTSDYVISIESDNTAYGTVDQSMLIVPYGTPYSVSGDELTVGSTVITATPTPTVVGDQYSYSFSGWNVSSGTVSDHMNIVATFVQSVREYTVTINVNNPSYGTVNKNSVTVPYGSTMVVMGGGVLRIGDQTVTTSPTPATIDTNYWFGEWTFPPGNPSGSTITHDITVTANFESGVRYYEITFVTLPVGYGTLDIDYPYSSSGGYHVSYGSTISVSDNELTIDGLTDMTATARPATQDVDWTYAFDNWTISAYTVTGDMTINANFTRTPNTVVNVTVSTPQGHFYEGGNEYTSHVFSVPSSSSISQDRATGTLYLWNYEITADMTVTTEQYEYTFFIWDGVPIGGGTVSDGMNISAIYHSEDRYYEVNFSIADGFGTISTESVSVLYNTLIYSENNVVVVGANTIIATPTENGEDVTYEFIRWDGIPMTGRILENTDISAKVMRTVTADAFNIVEIEHGDSERVWSIPDEYLPLMLVIPIMVLIGLVILSLNRKGNEDDYESY